MRPDSAITYWHRNEEIAEDSVPSKKTIQNDKEQEASPIDANECAMERETSAKYLSLTKNNDGSASNEHMKDDNGYAVTRDNTNNDSKGNDNSNIEYQAGGNILQLWLILMQYTKLSFSISNGQ